MTFWESGRYRGATNSPDSTNTGSNTPYTIAPTTNLDTKNCQYLVAKAEAKPTIIMIRMLGYNTIKRP